MKGDIDIDQKNLYDDSVFVDSFGLRGILKNSTISWVYLPEDVLLIIFNLLSGKDLANVVKVCSRWRLLADKEELWEKKFKHDFNVGADATLLPDFSLKWIKKALNKDFNKIYQNHKKRYIDLELNNLYLHRDTEMKERACAQSWKKEYERLSEDVPCVELDKIEEHTDEVLHVAFSNNGMMFCTCSKDAYVKVYNADWPFNTVFSAHHRGNNAFLNWKYTQLSQFSPCDTQLLVSGRCDVSEQSGEIVIYNIYAGIFSIQARVRIRPYDVMGSWLNETHILSAIAHVQLRNMQCLTEVILNKSAQDIENIHQSTMTRAFLFVSDNLAPVCFLQVADLAWPIRQVMKSNSGSDIHDHLHKMHCLYLKKEEALHMWRRAVDNVNTLNQICPKCLTQSTRERKVKRSGTNSPNYPKKTACFRFCTKNELRKHDTNFKDNTDPNVLLKSCGVLGSDTDSIAEPSGLRQYVSSTNSQLSQDFDETSAPPSAICLLCGRTLSLSKETLATQHEHDSSSATSADEESFHLHLPRSYKILLCFTGQFSSVPHQIGIKIIKQEECSQVTKRDISEQLRSSKSTNRPEVDHWDHKLELKGHGIGMALSPCNRYLYANVRKWEGNWRLQLRHPFPEPPPISTQVELVTFDLLTMTKTSTLTNHNSDNDVFFIHLSANDYYVASGSGDGCGYIWDRHYQARVGLLPHEDVVNCVAVNPRDPSMAVSVSDDKSIKIWRSKAFSRMLKGARPKARIKLRCHSFHK